MPRYFQQFVSNGLAYREFAEKKLLEAVRKIDDLKAAELSERMSLKRKLKSEEEHVLKTGLDVYCRERQVSSSMKIIILSVFISLCKFSPRSRSTFPRKP